MTHGSGTAGRTGRRVGSGPALVVVLFLAALSVGSASAQAQGVIELLVRQRLEARMAEISAELGPRVPPKPMRDLMPGDSIMASFYNVQRGNEARAEAAIAAFRDSVASANRLATLDWRKLDPGAQGDFLASYGEIFWKASEPRRRLAIDTTNTLALRGRLQKVFGRPTRNADALRQIGYTGSEYIQFEYWFVVNDSIPVLVMDLDGPFGRGLLLAGDESQADLLPILKEDLSARLTSALGPNPWVDYYHSFDRAKWFRTGYNGEETFVIDIRPPRWSTSARADRWIIHR